MANANLVILSGRISSDLRFTDVNGEPACDFMLTVIGNPDKFESMPVRVFGKSLEIARGLKNGDQISLDGRLTYSQNADKRGYIKAHRLITF